MRRLSVCLAVLVLLLAGCASAVDVSTLESVWKYQLSLVDTTLQGVAVTVFDSTSFTSKLSGAFGTSDKTNGDPMLLDSMVSMNTASEGLVVAAALRLVANGVLTLDGAISTTLLPTGSIPFVNPSYPSTQISIKMLMTHTSSLSDSTFETYKKTTGTLLADLQSFVTAYMLTDDRLSLRSGLFATGVQPGQYSYARINSALLSLVVELANRVTYGTALGYVRATVLAPLGMSNTVTLTLLGAPPALTYPSEGPVYGETMTELLNSGNQPTTARPIHPAYFSDYSTYTNTLDLTRFLRSLFLTSTSSSTANLITIGNSMKTKTITTATGVTGQTGAGPGTMFFNGNTMCNEALATSAVTKCPLTASSNIWGWVSSGPYSQVGWYCTDAFSGRTTCVTTVHTYTEASLKTVQLSYAMAAAAFQLTGGDTSTITQTTLDSSSRSSLYGVWVFFGVLGVLIFVLVASYFTEYIIQPAPIVSGVPVPQSMMPQQMARVPTDTYFNSA
jgi:CubicO group peptidase (beta-lactamase class C family)